MRDADHIADPARALANGAEVFLKDLLRLRRGEDLLVYLDQGSDRRVASAIQADAESRGARTETLTLSPGLPLAEQARQLGDRIRQGSFQAICELSEQYFYHTPAWTVAREVGARVFSLAGLDAAAFIRCVGQVNHTRMFEFGLALRRVLQASPRLRILTEKGTDLRMEFRLNPLLRVAARFRGWPRGYILPPCGLLDEQVPATFLGGQLAFRGIPRTIRGTAVIDGYLWPPAEIGTLDEPIVVSIRHGRVVEIAGSPAKSQILKRWFEGQDIGIEHFCMGFNPGARLSGKILEAERAFGCISLGMGKAAFHTDGVVKSPSIEADRRMIEKNGSFTCEDLSSLEQELLQREGNAK